MEWQFSLFEPIQSKGLQYSDSDIDVGFQIEKTHIGFYLQNNTDSGIKINWDDISFVSSSGKATRVIHSGIKLFDRDRPQAPTTIPPMVRIEDLFIPSENIKYVESNWSEESLFPGEYAVYNGLEFSLYFPMEIKGAKKDYFFKFKINEIVH